MILANLDEKFQLAAVMQDGYAIEYIKSPSEEVQLAAVTADQDDWYAIQFIPNPSEKVQLAAIQLNSLAIYYIQTPTIIAKLCANPLSPRNP